MPLGINMSGFRSRVLSSFTSEHSSGMKILIMLDALDSPKNLDSDVDLLVIYASVAIIELNNATRFNAESHGLLTALWHKLKAPGPTFVPGVGIPQGKHWKCEITILCCVQ